MKWWRAHDIVEELRSDTRLYLPSLSQRRGFSSCRVEHLLNKLVAALPDGECYLEVGVLEGRTLEAAAAGNPDKRLYGFDPCIKYDHVPSGFPKNVTFIRAPWEQITSHLVPEPIGVAFYDGDHSAEATAKFLDEIADFLAGEAVVVLDDWDRKSVRDGAFSVGGYELLREMPEYTDGLTTAPHHFGYQFGVAVFGRMA